MTPWNILLSKSTLCYWFLFILPSLLWKTLTGEANLVKIWVVAQMRLWVGLFLCVRLHSNEALGLTFDVRAARVDCLDFLLPLWRSRWCALCVCCFVSLRVACFCLAWWQQQWDPNVLDDGVGGMLCFDGDRKIVEGGGEIRWLVLLRWWCYFRVFGVVGVIFHWIPLLKLVLVTYVCREVLLCPDWSKRKVPSPHSTTHHASALRPLVLVLGLMDVSPGLYNIIHIMAMSCSILKEWRNVDAPNWWMRL